MDHILFTFLLTVLIVVIAVLFIVIIRQIKINKKVNDAIVAGSGNHAKDPSKYLGHYSLCEHIGD